MNDLLRIQTWRQSRKAYRHELTGRQQQHRFKDGEADGRVFIFALEQPNEVVDGATLQNRVRGLGGHVRDEGMQQMKHIFQQVRLLDIAGSQHRRANG